MRSRKASRSSTMATARPHLAGTPAPFSSGDYPLTITATDGIGAPDSEPFDLTVDDLPVVTISAPSEPFAVAGDSVTYTIDFTDDLPLDSALTAGDIQLVSPTGDASAQVDVFGPGTTTQGLEYQVTLSGFSGNGPIGISIPAGVVTNLTGEPSPAASGAPCFVETTPPAIVASPPSNPEPSEGGTVTYTVDYLDPNPFQSLAPTADDIQVVGEDDATALIAVSQAVPIPGGVEYTVTLSDLAGQGAVDVQIAAGTATDQAGNVTDFRRS